MDDRRTLRWRRIRQAAFATLVGLVGAWLGMLLLSRETVPMGPFEVDLSANVGPGATVIGLPPFGTLTATTHAGPIRLTATLENVGVQELTNAVRTRGLEGLARDVQHDAGVQVVRFGFRLLAVSLIGAVAFAALVFRTHARAIGIAVLAALLGVSGSGLLAWQTFTPAAFTTPTFSGALGPAAKLIGPVREATNKLADFRQGLEALIDGATRAYTSIQTSSLGDENVISVLHMSDIHESVLGMDFARNIAESFDVDFVIDTGDITSFGTPVEDLIATKIPEFGRPYVFVRGSHDSLALQAQIAKIPNAIVLDGDSTTVDGIKIYGLGDPAFTPAGGEATDSAEVESLVRGVGPRILADVQAMQRPPDVVAVHDDRMAEDSAGYVPLVISGHFHETTQRVIDGTLFLRIGTTGGSGAGIFRGLDIPFSAEILYFSKSEPHTLVAYDVIEQSANSGSLTVRRHVVDEQFGKLTPSPPPATPSPSLTPTGVSGVTGSTTS